MLIEVEQKSLVKRWSKFIKNSSQSQMHSCFLMQIYAFRLFLGHLHASTKQNKIYNIIKRDITALHLPLRVWYENMNKIVYIDGHWPLFFHLYNIRILLPRIVIESIIVIIIAIIYTKRSRISRYTYQTHSIYATSKCLLYAHT